MEWFSSVSHPVKKEKIQTLLEPWQVKSDYKTLSSSRIQNRNAENRKLTLAAVLSCETECRKFFIIIGFSWSRKLDNIWRLSTNDFLSDGLIKQKKVTIDEPQRGKNNNVLGFVSNQSASFDLKNENEQNGRFSVSPAPPHHPDEGSRRWKLLIALSFQ